MNLKPRLSRGATATRTEHGWQLTLPAGPTTTRYRLSQIDDHWHIPRQNYPYRPPLTFSLQARASSKTIPGTWGFGLWNDPFGFSFGPSEGFFHLPALPNAVWFFHASPQSYLSFREGKPANGFLAQSFRAPRFHRSLITAALSLPFARKTTRRLLSRIIDEDGASVSADVTQWHGYSIQWSPMRVVFRVDNATIFESSVSPNLPLGIVIWIDNQYAAFTPEGKIRYGMLAGDEEWIEVSGIEIREE